MTTTLVEQIEEMRVRMNQLARREQDLVRADTKLLQDVRNVSLEHELRREGVLRELQSLATRMGALPMPREPYASLENAPLDLPNYEASQPAPYEARQPAPYEGRQPSPYEGRQPPRTGDWRQAAANLREQLPN